ncbi:hypothetical protein SAMN05192574_102611 [Mucilaginibacter gossypiicola]|uniref:Uncharacterized protein n=1 Tax=Mucilaginibacter gossypiicola TaxID=551995 RepID=A0A1H8E8K9_9SPHI|nr:hypothetical protein SAMN05192574_102611 [Mucilaginibacter gossypiicola]
MRSFAATKTKNMSLRGGTTKQSHTIQSRDALATGLPRYARNDIGFNLALVCNERSIWVCVLNASPGDTIAKLR